MQRIDENTYIDDTLVTCAEYQLFIDEMREQGKFYQPDHWTSYQFSEGQAREPILGVRPSDAAEFCKWLVLQSDGKWKFRVPNYKEPKQFPLDIHKQQSVGYRIENSYFEWIGNHPSNARGISIEVEQFASRNEPLNLNLTYERALSREQVRASALAIARTNARPIDRDLARARIAAQKRIKNLVHALDPIIARNIRKIQSQDWDHALKLAKKLASEIYVDLFTLQERIAGRSPAFEGIRLVKYREQSETLSDIGNSPT